MKMTEEQERNLINLRRSKVLELLSKGHTNQAEIAGIVRWSEPTVSRDIKFLKGQAEHELETHIKERIPLEYLRVRTGLNDILRKAVEILEKATDPNLQIKTMELLMNLYKSIMFLSTDGAVIEQAMKKAQGLQSQEQRKEDFQDDEEPDQTPTEPGEDLREEQ
jgi:hypothetical protein